MIDLIDSEIAIQQIGKTCVTVSEADFGIWSLAGVW